MVPLKLNHIKQLITLAVITLSCFHCIKLFVFELSVPAERNYDKSLLLKQAFLSHSLQQPRLVFALIAFIICTHSQKLPIKVVQTFLASNLFSSHRNKTKPTYENYFVMLLKIGLYQSKCRNILINTRYF